MAVVTTAHQAAIANLYIALFNRAPDADGFAFWTQALANGASIESLAQSFVQTPEAQAIYPVSQTAAQFVTTYYTNVLGRPIDASGLAFWTQILDASGGVNSNFARALVVSKIVEVVNTPLPVKPEELTDAAYALTFADRNAFKNKVDISIFYATDYKGNDLNLAKQVLTVIGPVSSTIDVAKALLNPPAGGGGATPAPVPAEPGIDYVGTSGADGFAGKSGDDTFTFVIDKTTPANTTLNTNDKISGAAGNDTLTVTTTGTVTGGDFAFASMTGIETVVIKRTDASAVTYNALADVKSVSVENGAGAININDLRQDAKLSLKNTAAAQVTAWYETVATTTTVALDGGVDGTKIQLNAAGLTSVTITSTGAPNIVDRFLTSPQITTVKLVADTDLSFNYLQASSNGATLDISGGAKVSLNVLVDPSLRIINASQNSGGLSATLSTNNPVVKITGSSGNDTISTADAVLTSGWVNAGGGDGDRLIVNSSLALASKALGDKYTNFEILQVENGVSVDLDNIDGIKSVEINDGGAATGVSNLTSTQAEAVKILRADGTGAITIGLKNADVGTTDTVKASLTTGTAGAPQVNLTGLTLVDVEKLELTGTGPDAAEFGNNGLLTLTTENATSLNSIVIKNAATVYVTIDAAHAAAGLSIDASASTGNTTINASAYTNATGATLKGGAGADRLTGSAHGDVLEGGAGADTLEGGAGNDVFVFGKASSTMNAFDTIISLNLGTNSALGRVDMLRFENPGATVSIVTLDGGQQSAVTAEASLALAAARVLTYASTDGATATFLYGGQTYLIHNGDGISGFDSANDFLIQITGVTGVLDESDIAVY